MVMQFVLDVDGFFSMPCLGMAQSAWNTVGAAGLSGKRNEPNRPLKL